MIQAKEQEIDLSLAVAVARAVFNGEYPRGLILNFAVILLLCVAAFFLGVRRMKKRLIR